MELVIAASPVDAGIGCWDLRSGSEILRYRSCASPRHGLLTVADRFLASSQLPTTPAAASAPIFFWSWDKPQVEVKSFPAEPIGPLVANSDGTYLIGGGSSGTIYLWEVVSGSLLTKWYAHYCSVTCLVLSNDESLLISGFEDGTVRIWNLVMMFDPIVKAESGSVYMHSFMEHTLRVTDIVSGHGLCNSIIISSSEDRTCKIWSLSQGRLLRSISFPAIIDAVAIDPGEDTFYAGGRDGKIYIAALNAEHKPNSSNWPFIIGALYDHSKAITSVTLSSDGITLVSGSEDGTVRIWDIKSQHVIRVLKHAKGPVTNVLIVRQSHQFTQQPVNAGMGISQRRANFIMPPPLSRNPHSADDEKIETKAVILSRAFEDDAPHNKFFSSNVLKTHLKELQENTSASVAELELERLRLECRRSNQMVQEWKKLYREMQHLYTNELLNGTQDK